MTAALRTAKPSIHADTGESGARCDLPPLVLDLDRSLIRCDILHETAIGFLRRNPFGIFKVVRWLMQGRAVLKRRLAEQVAVDVDSLPVNEELAAYAAAEKAKGRQVVLATATDLLLATAIARRFPFIDRVIASDGVTNMKGAAKAEALAQAFPDGFSYAGDSSADLPVWRRADTVVLVEAPRRIEREAARFRPVEATFPRPSIAAAFAKAARLHQWAKNGLVFVPLVLGGEIGNTVAWANAAIAFVAIGVLASTTYLLNDLFDLPEDRRHWSKRLRPLASGHMPISTAVLSLPIGFALAFGLAAIVGAAAVALLAAYLILTVAYSMALKRQPIVDAFVLALLFTMRLGLGIASAGVVVSPWLLVFSMFLFASLSFAKRHTEVERMAALGERRIAGRGYITTDGPLLLAMGVASGLAAIVIMVLYLINDAFKVGLYANPIWLWAFPPILFLWIGRVWLLCQRGELNDDPVAFAIRDRTSLMLGAVMGLTFLGAWYGLGA
ncbi:4-hydroxybenzoate polyprenyltransferase [Tepidamorphus gemmatus]|uniref:4-hydroxybenzoate polyprenyltransferase n=1 Tax=Tepidamorphus gemmatus TaxID=747076 RepID=A0A4R3M6V4_9HYPH|nr:UbiA family prenyltransferase [Tepidamorphus gemmatus]TCT09164.1 4-hydroxybenzoate polyprenyltransferase [Tepidamorphus gemmatus]